MEAPLTKKKDSRMDQALQVRQVETLSHHITDAIDLLREQRDMYKRFAEQAEKRIDVLVAENARLRGVV